MPQLYFQWFFFVDFKARRCEGHQMSSSEVWHEERKMGGEDVRRTRRAAAGARKAQFSSPDHTTKRHRSQQRPTHYID
ncbi:unnamed protein product, partial [Brenthis ino]